MKIAKANNQTASQYFQTLSQIQRNEQDIVEDAPSYAYLNSLYQQCSLLQSRLTAEVGPQRVAMLIKDPFITRLQKGING